MFGRGVIQVRDFEGVDDDLGNDEEPFTLSKEHHYNLLNQGWMAPGTRPAPALAEGENTFNSGSPPPVGTTNPDAPASGGGEPYFDPYEGVYRIPEWHGINQNEELQR